MWQIATPGDWNLEVVEATLRNPSNKDEIFKKIFVRKGSLIMLTTIASSILRDPEAFESAVISFLTKMIEDCNINTEIPCQVDVTLHILNANEVNVSCKLPNIHIEDKVVQTEDTDYEHQTRIEKHWNECEIFDVAFLNSDNQREIEWIQNISTVLKAKYDITCAIPTQNYLYGFPLKHRLFQYLNKCQAVILTVTEANYAQYESYMDDKMSLIIVELDYISEIRRKLWKFPYINCTTCEHLWFPRLIDTLKTKLPDHLRKKIQNVKDEQDEHCDKCKSALMTAVYHKVELRNYTGFRKQLFVIFCGSLIDDAWILNFLNQKTEFMKPYTIYHWYKTLKSQFTEETSSKVFVCVSPNIHKCRLIGEYVNYLVNDNTITVHLIKIATAEIPKFLGHLPNCIDATTMDQKELAHKLFPPPAAKILDHMDQQYSQEPELLDSKCIIQ
ncbi:uncharacterized protein LOC127723685 [Mytilus californianus]|uniref:uncharacterized protein LOC127723685 n=1 Tax=Mytilus californianus TaxID=6549 RepID=UPI002247EDAC|nr:uncharacterized protein LOC127723685 [Mytilus californianus]